MDPVGPWSAYAYNRLAGATGGFQASPASGGGDFVTSHHHLATTGNTSLGSHQPPSGGVPSTTSQLLLQAAHTTATLAGQLGQLTAAPGSTPSPFSPGGFLTPPSVGYDSVFSPLFHHANPKPAHYGSTLNVSQHRQALAQAQAAASKSNAVDSELSSLRENYSTAHQTIAAAAAASSNSFFEHQGPSSSSLAWTHQGNSQLPSPFGILPHETVVTSPGPATTKASSTYESTFNAHFVAAQSLNHLNSQLATASTDFNKSSNSYIENANKKTRSQSPHIAPVKTIVSSSLASGGNSFYNQTSSSAYGNSDSVSSRNCAPIAGNFSNKSQHITSAAEYTSSTKSYTTTSSIPQQPSCIVSTTTSSSVSSKEYRAPQPSPRSSSSSVFMSSPTASPRPPQTTEKTSSRTQNFVPPSNKATLHHGIQTKAQTKIYPELATTEHTRHGDNTHESSQSSPISFAMMDASTHRQGLNYSGAPSTTSLGSGSNASKISDNHSSSSNVQQTQQFQHVLATQTPADTVATTNTSYPSRHFSGLAASESASDYHHGSRNVKSSSSADSPYSERLMSSSSASSQNSPDCGVVVPRRPSPLQAHSQASPLSHVPSPGYPLYNSPVASMSSPSPLQLHSETSGNQCSNGNTRQHNGNPSSQQVTPASPLDASVPRPSTQSTQVAYSSVITRALTTGEGSSKSFNSETRSQLHHQEYPQKQNCWDSAERPVPSSRTAGKFTGSNVNYNTSSNVGLDIPHVPPQTSSVSQVRGTSDIADRQSTYFESNPGQVTLQDLSNCRGDPMTIVKNLQTLQQPCQIQQSMSSQPMKSDERPASGNSTASTNSENQPSSESSSCATPIATPAPTIQEELPKVIVPNIEEELGFLAEVNDIPVTATAATSSSVVAPVKPGPSRRRTPVTSKPASSKMPEKKPFTYSNPGSGFMASYLKFLQGERDSSPPQSKRGGKAWSRNKLYQPPDVPKAAANVTTTSNNSTTTTTLSVVPAPTSAPSVLPTSADSQALKPKETPAYDPQDDPRYFPLKKERNGSFSDSDDDFDPSKDSKNKVLVKEEAKELQKESELVIEPVKEEKSKTKPVVKVSAKSVAKSQVTPNSKTTVEPDVKLSVSDSASSVCSANEKTGESSALKTTAQPATEDSVKSIPRVSDDDQPLNAVNIDKSPVVDKGKKSSTKKSKKKRELEEDLPRRELARRAVKEKALSNLNQQVLLDEEFDVDEPEFMDSDSDPAWTPAKDSSDDEGSNRRRTRRSVSLLNSRKRARLMSSSLTEDEAASSSESQDVPSSLDRSRRQTKQKSPNKGRGRPRKFSVVTPTESIPCPPKAASPPAAVSPSVSSDVAAVPAPAPAPVAEATTSEKEAPNSGSENKEPANSSAKKEESCEMPFKSGEFVVMKSDLKDDHPPIWRIDGKTLLQKYEAFQENGKTLYRNISTYSGWTSQNKHVYQQVRVKFRVQNRMETIVELLKDELYSDDDVFEKSMKETVKYQDNFEVYIQTLISQALDSNFLPEILQEGDEYFLASVKKVDDITEERKQRLLKVTKWKMSVVNSVGTWPCFNVIKDLPVDEKFKLCPACGNCSASVRVQMYGQPYNSTTLEGCPPDPKIASEKDFLLCKICLGRVELYHKVAHQKYLMFIECSQRVAEKRNENDTTVILNELLANETWLSELFQSVRTSWAEIDKLAHQVEKSEK